MRGDSELAGGKAPLTVMGYPDLTTGQFSYDPAGNLQSYTNNRDQQKTFGYDGAGRRVSTRYETDGTRVVERYDAVGNRVWRVERNGDVLQYTFTYDVEGRRSSIACPGASPVPVSSLSYDIVGKLMGIDTRAGSTELLPLNYGYDLASNRVALTAGTDTLDYGVDAANQLVQEDLNRLVERSLDRFSTGTFSLCTIDPSTGGVTLLPSAESLEAPSVNCDRCRFAYADGAYVGLEVRPLEGALQFCFPRGFCNNVQTLRNPYGLNDNLVWVAAEHRLPLSGDFDVSVDFSNYQGKMNPGGGGKGPERFGALTAALCVSPEPLERITSSSATYVCIARDNTPCYRATAMAGGVSQLDVSRRAHRTPRAGSASPGPMAS